MFLFQIRAPGGVAADLFTKSVPAGILIKGVKRTKVGTDG